MLGGLPIPWYQCPFTTGSGSHAILILRFENLHKKSPVWCWLAQSVETELMNMSAHGRRGLGPRKLYRRQRSNVYNWGSVDIKIACPGSDALELITPCRREFMITSYNNMKVSWSTVVGKYLEIWRNVELRLSVRWHDWVEYCMLISIVCSRVERTSWCWLRDGQRLVRFGSTIWCLCKVDDHPTVHIPTILAKSDRTIVLFLRVSGEQHLRRYINSQDRWIDGSNDSGSETSGEFKSIR